MIFSFLASFFLFFNNSYATDSKEWSRKYQIILKDIKTIENLKKKDLSLAISLFELYVDKFSLLLEKENEMMIVFLEKNNKNDLNKVTKLKNETLKEIKSISDIIIKNTRDDQIIANISYYSALTFHFDKKEKLFLKYLKKAESLNKNKILSYKINEKLADYYYDKNQFKIASRYYASVLSDRKNYKLSKYFYNLAWCEFKNKNKDNTLKFIQKASELEKTKKYLSIGPQLIDSVMLFFAFFKETRNGLSYLKKNNQFNFDNFLKFLHYVFEHGNKKSTLQIFDSFNKDEITDDQYYQYINKKIIFYRSLRLYKKIYNDLIDFERKFSNKKKHNVKFESKSELISSLTGYAGYLQEILKSGMVEKKNDKARYIDFIKKNFDILSIIDESNRMKYSYFIGETFFSIHLYDKAIYYYLESLNYYKITQNKKLASKVFESIFKSLEKNKSSEKYLKLTYEKFLKIFPNNHNNSKAIYKKLSLIFALEKKHSKFVETLNSYHRNYKNRISEQKEIFLKYLNTLAKEKNVDLILKTKSDFFNGDLKFLKKIINSKKIESIVESTLLEKYEFIAKNDFEKGIDGFLKIFKNNDLSYQVRLDAMYRRLFYLENKKKNGDLYNSLIDLIIFVKNRPSKKYYEEIVFYVNKICLSGDISKCEKIINIFKKNKFLKFNDILSELSFMVALYGNAPLKTSLSMAKTFERKYLFLQTLLLNDPYFKSPYYEQLYSDLRLKKIIEELVDFKFWRIYLTNLDFKSVLSFVKNISILNLRTIYSRNIVNFRNILKNRFVFLPKFSNKTEVTFESFSKFNQNLTEKFMLKVKETDMLLKKINQNFIPIYLTQVILDFDKEIEVLKSFRPKTSDGPLKKAIENEVANVLNILSLKKLEYKKFYKDSIDKNSSLSGIKSYSDSVMKNNFKVKFNGVILWGI